MNQVKLILVYALSVGLNFSGFCQDVDGTARVSFDFSVFPLEPGNWTGILYAPNGDPEKGTKELLFNPHERTLGFSYNGPTPVVFFREMTNSEGVIEFQRVGTIDPGEGKLRDDIMLFFLPLSETETYNVSFMFDSPNTFPEDSLVFFNTTGATFFGILGEERLRLAPGASEPIDLNGYFEEPTPIGLVIEREEGYQKVLMNKLRFSPDRRTLMILRSPKNPNSFRIRTQRLTEYTGSRGSSDVLEP
ncbi:MAG: hypothetical protein AAF065_00975 [Verrucomicrobiota bacterium]